MKHASRPLALAAAAALSITASAQRRTSLGPVDVVSPGRAVAVRLLPAEGDAARMKWQVTLHGKPVIEPSAIGIVIDRRDLGEGAAIVRTESYRVNEKYPW